MTAAIASISRPNVSSADRLGGGFALAPGAGGAAVNFASIGCPPSVPLYVAGGGPGTVSASGCVVPSSHVTSPVRRPCSSVSFPAVLPDPLTSTNWPDCLRSNAFRQGCDEAYEPAIAGFASSLCPRISEMMTATARNASTTTYPRTTRRAGNGLSA